MFAETLTDGALSPGYFGKLPTRGDFVTRNLPRSFREPWDHWLQAAMTASRQQLGEAWLEHYLVSPLWRFTLSAGVCGETAYAGVLMPSVDRVGRYFPLAIAAPVPEEANFLELAATPWFERAEQVALAGLDENMDPEAFDKRVKALGLPGAVSRLGDSDFIGDPAWHCPLTSLAALSRIGADLAGHFLRWRFGHFSLWWSHGAEGIAPGLLICQGLPPIEGFAALLAGDWAQRGWRQSPLAIGDPPVGPMTAAAESP